MAETSTILKAIMGKILVISFMHSFNGDKKLVEIFVKKDIKDKIKLCINGGYIAGDDF